MAKITIIIEDAEGGGINFHMDSETPMSLLDKDYESWTEAQQIAYNIHYQIGRPAMSLSEPDEGGGEEHH